MQFPWRSHSPRPNPIFLVLFLSHLSDELELKPSPKKTHIATFSQGFEFLGFGILLFENHAR
uniref:Uncharacterized protein n=1 Tax=Candidatus Kentrum sp. TC TaxID=2126339 RepID=A0A450ZU81_9GAMM|nr:MAG: hypothetical protein BECKTC1821D_GA0114238_101419 [Candidatus Kentron sp. TC]VFK57288.1 MAG: hypothetical protein BECKTC1821F_GA0114240_101636 [Candidatus Kentron sp. TC]